MIPAAKINQLTEYIYLSSSSWFPATSEIGQPATLLLIESNICIEMGSFEKAECTNKMLRNKDQLNE